MKFSGDQVPYFAYNVARIRVADEEILKKFITQAHNVGRIAISFTDRKTVLNQLELTQGNQLLNAGKVLFSDDVLQDLQMGIFATDERLTFNDIQRVHGPILRLVDVAENYIRNNIHWRVEFTGEMQRKEIPEIPTEAIREALLNSCRRKWTNHEPAGSGDIRGEGFKSIEGVERTCEHGIAFAERETKRKLLCH